MSAIVVNDLSITSLETIMCFGINGGAHRFTLDELQNATIGNTQENTALTGKGGRTIGQLKRNKAVKVSGTNGMVSMGLVEPTSRRSPPRARSHSTEPAAPETSVRTSSGSFFQ